MQSLQRSRSTFHINAWLGGACKYGSAQKPICRTFARAGNEWHHSAWDFRNPISSNSDKVHLDVQFSRYRADGSVLGWYRSIWVVSLIKQRWAAQLRSSFAA